MESRHIMVILIVAIVMIAGVVRSRHAGRHGRNIDVDPQERAETLRLRDEVKQLKDRIHVLERIAVEKEDTLSREIDQLRDR